MRILVVSSFLPYPLFNGGHIRLYNLIKRLAIRHKITLICEIRQNQTSDDIKEVSKYCEEIITIPRKKQWSYRNILRTGFSPYPFLLQGHTLPEMKACIVNKLNEKSYDLIHVETFYVNQNLPKTYLPVVLAEHNIEYNVYERYAATAKAYIRPLLYIDIAKTTYWEKYFWKKATKLIAVSAEDKEKMTTIRSDIKVVPNGVDCDTYKFKDVQEDEEKEKRILFIGDFKWIQNRNAASQILNDIWPLIKEKRKINARLWIVGKNIPDSLKALADDTVIFGEHESDTVKIYKNSDILLAPLKVGGGSSYKIIEAMASGVPVVTSVLGAKGIGAKPGEELFVGETPEELAQHVFKLLQNKTVYEKMRKKARLFIESKYDWKIIAEELERVYSEVAAQT